MYFYFNPQTNRKQSAYIEKNNGDITMRQDKFELALKHYNSALRWLKILFDENIITNEKEADLFVHQIGVIKL